MDESCIVFKCLVSLVIYTQVININQKYWFIHKLNKITCFSVTYGLAKIVWLFGIPWKLLFYILPVIYLTL